MGATEILRSTKELCLSSFSPIFSAFSIIAVSAPFLRISVILPLASATKVLPESVVAPGELAMAHILARKRDSGIRYTANVRIKKNGVVVHRESKTFELRAAAEKWARAREVALEDPTALIRVQHGAPSLAELIRWYIDAFEMISKWQRSKQTHLEFLERHPIGESNALLLTTPILVDHVRARRAGGAGPATVANDLTWIGVVLRAAKSVRALPVDPRCVEEARNACRELRLIGKSKKRTRRPTPDELTKLAEFFRARDRRSVIPMGDIVQFAIASARREAEICRLLLSSNERASICMRQSLGQH